MHTLFWLRTDLRAHDNPALAAAARDGTVTALFLAAPGQWKLHGDAPAKVDFWLRNLHAVARPAGPGHPLKLLTVNDWREAPDAIARFCADHGIARVHANAEWGLNERRRDEAVAAALGEADVEWTLHQGGTLLPPGSVLTGRASATASHALCARLPRSCAARWRQSPRPVRRRRRRSADALPNRFDGFDPPSDAVRALWPPARMPPASGWPALSTRPSSPTRATATSVATRHELPVALSGRRRAVGRLRAAQAANLGELDSGKAGIATWINELLWREFYQHLLAAYPELSMHRPMKPETAHVPWRDAPEDLLAAGRQDRHPHRRRRHAPAAGAGLDAQPAAHGDGDVPVQEPADRLAPGRSLVHGASGGRRPAANNGGWQWSASTGADAVPYFRVFNPLSQSRKFDPDGVFLREWLPELAHLPGDAIHDPSPMERAAAGYPRPSWTAGSRLRALEAFGNLPRA